MTNQNCPSCGNSLGKEMSIKLDVSSSNCSLQLGNEKRDSELLPITLFKCDCCDLLFNSKFDENLLDYENNLLSSYFNHGGAFKSYEVSIQRILKNSSNFSERWIIFEFGCGDGEYLKALSDAACAQNTIEAEVLGFDLSITSETSHFTKDIDRARSFISGRPVIFVCRHTLEHLSDSSICWELIKFSSQALIYIEVPNGEHALLEGNLEDVIYDHVSYFSIHSLAQHALIKGAKILELFSLLGGENLGLLCSYDNHKKTETLNDNWLLEHLEYSTKSYFDDVEKLSSKLRQENIVFWGVGGRCLSLLSRSTLNSNTIFPCRLVDSDKNKWGKIIPGFKHPITSPKKLNLGEFREIIVGTRVGYPFIQQELEFLLSGSNFKLNINFWRDVE